MTFEEIYQTVLRERGYLVLGSSVENTIGARHDGGRYGRSVSQPFYVIAPTNMEDMQEQAKIFERCGECVEADRFEYYYRVQTD